MKKINRALLLIAVVISILAGSVTKASAGTDNGNGNNGENNGNAYGKDKNETFLPINNGVFYLLIVGAVGGVFVLNRKKLAGKTK